MDDFIPYNRWLHQHDERIKAEFSDRPTEALAEECGVDYLDANYDREAIQFDWYNDTFDGGDHLNLFGARKMTKYLGDYMKQECDLTDHRDDPKYRSWHEQLKEYEQEVKDMEGTSYPKIEEEIKKSKQHMPDDSDGSGTKGRK